jgi:hypothetical protein
MQLVHNQLGDLDWDGPARNVHAVVYENGSCVAAAAFPGYVKKYWNRRKARLMLGYTDFMARYKGWVVSGVGMVGKDVVQLHMKAPVGASQEQGGSKQGVRVEQAECKDNRGHHRGLRSLAHDEHHCVNPQLDGKGVEVREGDCKDMRGPDGGKGVEVGEGERLEEHGMPQQQQQQQQEVDQRAEASQSVGARYSEAGGRWQGSDGQKKVCRKQRPRPSEEEEEGGVEGVGVRSRSKRARTG